MHTLAADYRSLPATGSDSSTSASYGCAASQQAEEHPASVRSAGSQTRACAAPMSDRRCKQRRGRQHRGRRSRTHQRQVQTTAGPGAAGLPSISHDTRSTAAAASGECIAGELPGRQALSMMCPCT